MSNKKINIRTSVLVIMILVAVSFRFVDLGESFAWGNFTPVGAIALFAGTYFRKNYQAYLVPLAIMLLSDCLLTHKYIGTFNPYYTGVELVYLSFVAMVFIGRKIKTVNVKNVFLAAVAGVLVHWLLTDIQPWLQMPIYTKDFSGYVNALIAAIPFEKNLLIGNLVFSALLYGGFELSKSKVAVLKETKSYSI